MVEEPRRGRLRGKSLVFTEHARLRMQHRNIPTDAVHSVADSGEVIETYADDTPHPSELVLGWVDARPLHVVLGYNEADDEHLVITAYEPDINLWRSDFRERRR